MGAVGLALGADLSTSVRHRLSAGAWGFIPFQCPDGIFFFGAELSGGASYGFGPAAGPGLWWKVSPRVRGHALMFFPGLGLFIRGDHALAHLSTVELSAGAEVDLLVVTAVAAHLFLK